MASADDKLARVQLYADANEQLLICCRSECQYALSTALSQVTSHLRDKHNVPDDLRKGLTQILRRGYPYSFRNPTEVALRADGSPIHPKLRLYEGFACRKCKYRTISYSEFSRHASKTHLDGRQASRSRISDIYDDVYLQTWTHGAARRYWMVQKDGSLVRPVADQAAHDHLQSIYEREHKRLELQGRTGARDQDSGPQTLVASRPWMDRTRWAITYDGVRGDILQALAVMPYNNGRSHFLGHGSCDGDPGFFSPPQDEQKLCSLIAVVNRMVDRCEETMQHTSRPLLCRLRSTKPNICYPKPFTLVSLKASEKKYRRYYEQFIVFVFRAFRMPPGVRRRLTGIRFTKGQREQLQAIWEHEALGNADLARSWRDMNDFEELERKSDSDSSSGDGAYDENSEGYEMEDGEVDDEDDEEDDDEGEEEEGEEEGGEEEEGEEEEGEEEEEDDDDDEEEEERRNERAVAADDSPIGQLLELIFQLSMKFSMEQFIDGQPSSSLLVYFSGVLGFSANGQNFLPAKRYTPCLSGLIYIQRLLFLEHALPFRPYPCLGIPRRPRLQQYEQLDLIRHRYMVTGSQSPLEEFQSLRDFGRVIARTDPPSFLLHWSDDGETLFYGDDFSLTMESFRGLADHFLSKAEELCADLLFDLDLVVDLTKIKDDMTNVQNGFSFVQHPGNRLAHAYLDLSAKACTTRRNGLFRNGQWDWKAIFSYRRKAEALEEMILGGLHTACGQVPRAPELLGLECENGSSTERGLYVWNGFMVYLTRHHKAKRSTNREFVVVRFMPVRLGHIMYKYAVWIRRFLDMLDRERSPESVVAASQKRLLFRSSHAPDKPWDASRLTAILRKATAEVWGQSVNSQLYRQLTIGITEKHVREVHQSFNQYDDRGATADLNVVLAWQSGHRPIQRTSTYGLDGAFPTKLQPALLRVYEWASTRWHEFLHQPSKVMPLPKSIKEPWKQPAPEPSPPSQSTKRKLSQINQDPSETERGAPHKRGWQPLEAPERAESAPARPIRAVVARIDAWRKGEIDRPMSDNESDSSIDWDEADTIPCKATGGSWDSWRRHNERIEAKLEKTRDFCGVFEEKDFNNEEQRAFEALRGWLEEWRGRCAVCHFLPTVPACSHSVDECESALSQHLRPLSSKFQTRMSRLAVPQTLSCPWCFVPRVICNRWTKGAANRWVDSSKECQYAKIIIPAILVMVEFDKECRDTLDTWLDLHGIYSRNLEKLCQWLSGRSVGDNLYAIRVAKVFLLLRDPWLQMSRRKSRRGYVPQCNWISSTFDETRASEIADQAAYRAREDERQRVIARNQREGRDQYHLEDRLESWVGKCPVCYTRKRMGYNVDVYHKLEMCKDEKRELVSMEIAKLQEIKFTNGICCKLCAVPQETCYESMDFGGRGKEKCLYRGIVREAVAAIMVVGPDAVVEKMYAWMRSERIWIANAMLSGEEVEQVTQMMLEWFSQQASWRHFAASVLVQVFNQLDRWVEAFGKGVELEDWLRAD